jgi:AraC family transcriptional regulator of adaptative response/methylated-DNA-[protein]-cysteine methyltransferase
MPTNASHIFDTDDLKWTAVSSNNVQADGHFYYAVTTTGIVCNPSCPSRTPRRTHVQYFDHVLAAEKAGFRRCKRCSP